MSLGLQLRTSLSGSGLDPVQLLEATASWISRAFAEMKPSTTIGERDGAPALFCKFHPAAEDLELVCPDSAQLVASANTTTVGPGYHIFVASLLRSWAAEFEAVWEERDNSSEEYGDETGFFFSMDEDNLRDEMCLWLKALAGSFFDGTLEPGITDIALCMPMNPQFQTGETTITPLGPRSLDWFRKTAQDGRNGRDFFAWWDSGQDASYYLGRALAQIWTDVRWRKPVNDAEHNTLLDVTSSLRRAYLLDPTRDYPWAELNQILNFLETDSEAEERAWLQPHNLLRPVMGYRRGNVRTKLPGGWTIRVSGAFSDFEPDENGALCAVDPPREIWFTAFRMTTPMSDKVWNAEVAEIRGAHPEFLFDRDRSLGQAQISTKLNDSGEIYYILNSSVQTPSKRAVCTIVFAIADDKDWALETWRSIQPPDE